MPGGDSIGHCLLDLLCEEKGNLTCTMSIPHGATTIGECSCATTTIKLCDGGKDYQGVLPFSYMVRVLLLLIESIGY